jgi:hypothetical protein
MGEQQFAHCVFGSVFSIHNYSEPDHIVAALVLRGSGETDSGLGRASLLTPVLTTGASKDAEVFSTSSMSLFVLDRCCGGTDGFAAGRGLMRPP